MKLEEMSRDQLIAYVKAQWKTIDELKFQTERLEDRWQNTNKLLSSYINEFADRGLVYVPKNPKNPT